MWAGMNLQACGSQMEAGSYSKRKGKQHRAGGVGGAGLSQGMRPADFCL